MLFVEKMIDRFVVTLNRCVLFLSPALRSYEGLKLVEKRDCNLIEFNVDSKIVVDCLKGVNTCLYFQW